MHEDAQNCEEVLCWHAFWRDIFRHFVGVFETKASHIFNLETWALTNIAFETSDNTNAVIDREAILVFVKLLDPPSEDIREQVVGP